MAALIRPLAFALGALATWFSFRRLVSQDPERAEIELRIVASRWRWLNRFVYAAITGVLTGWAVALLIEVLGAVVVGAEISRMAAITATAIGGGLLAGAIAYASADLDRRGLTTRVSAMLVSGLLLSMLTANDPTWWTDSLSHMGQQPDWGWIFNATMILAGLGMLGVTMEITRGLKLLAEARRFPPSGARFLTIALAIAAFGLTGVGVFPTYIYPISMFFHNLSSNLMLLVFLVLMLGLRWIAPPLGKRVHLASMVLGVVCLLDLALYITHLFGFVFFEIVAILILVLWLFLFESATSATIHDCGSDTVLSA
jgi:MFS family permease